jgi:hypothetical protein
MGVPITEAALESLLLHGFRDCAFRLEAQPSYTVGIEQDALREFAEGNPRSPSEHEWWQEWLALMADHRRRGRTLERVRIVTEPPTAYQEWLRWGDRWHVAAGERIYYLRRSQADAIGLPTDADWWLFDQTQAAVIQFAPGGEMARIELLTSTAAVAPYCQWRDVALQHATAAQGITA